MDLTLWNDITKNDYSEFTSLKNGAKIALLLPNTDNLIVLEKIDGRVLIHSDHREEFDFPFAQIAFKFSEYAFDKLNETKSFSTLLFLAKKEEIGIMSFVNENELTRYNFNKFLKKFGYEIGSNCSCGCC